MENETETLNSTNEEQVVVTDDDSPDVIKEKFAKLNEAHTKTLEANRQLFARTKKAEGFEQDAEGNWVKTIIKETEKKSSKKADTKQSDELDYGAKAFLLASG